MKRINWDRVAGVVLAVMMFVCVVGMFSYAHKRDRQLLEIWDVCAKQCDTATGLDNDCQKTCFVKLDSQK